MSDKPRKRQGPIGWLIEWYQFDPGLVVIWASILLLFAGLFAGGVALSYLLPTIQ